MVPTRTRRLWVFTTYFAEGLPFMVVRYLAGVFLTDVGLKEAWLGYLNFLGIPWNTKFLWAPVVDLVSTKRAWLVRIELLITVFTALLTVFGAFGKEAEAGSKAIRLFITMLVILAFVAATHDVAIDGFYMEAIPGTADQAAYTGLRVMAYRIAVIFAKSLIVAMAGWFSWTMGFSVATVTMGALFLFHQAYLPRPEAEGRGVDASSASSMLKRWASAFWTWLDQPLIGLVIPFIITYKLGDELLFCMNTPFLMREIGVDKEQLSWIAGIVGTTTSIGGSLASAWIISKWGLKKAIWPLTLFMNFNIWAYVWLAWAHPDPTTTFGIWLVAGVHGYEQFAAGLGNAVLVIYLMRTCKPDFKAAHYAIASAIPSLGGTILGGFGGLAVEAIGYLNLYILAFFVTLPSMVILFFLPLDEPPSRGS